MVDEKTLVKQLKNSKTQEQAFRVLMTLYKERLYWHIRKIVKSHDDADDVLQNTFIKVYRSIEKFNSESKIYSWMYRIATNESITFINKRAKEKNIDILNYVSKHNSLRPKLVIGFAAETNNVEENAKKKLEEKNCDWIIANDVSNKAIGFDSSFNEVSIYYREKNMNDEKLAIKSKSEISDEIVDRVIKKLN